MVQLEEKERDKVFMYRYSPLPFFLGKPAVVSASEIDLMQDHLNGIHKDIKVTTLRVGQFSYNYRRAFFRSKSKVVQTDNTKVKLELTSLGMSIT